MQATCLTSIWDERGTAIHFASLVHSNSTMCDIHDDCLLESRYIYKYKLLENAGDRDVETNSPHPRETN